MAILEEIQASIVRLAQSAGASVVGVGQRWGLGSGIVLGEGRVLTNAHNVRGAQVAVTFTDGRTAEGNLAGHDIDGDLAVVQADTAGAPALPWATGAVTGIGTPVFALANPGGRGLRVTFGFVSGIERTAPLLPGSSGGPVLDAAGHLLGINTNRLGEGFYLAIPADEALRGRVDALARGQSTAPPRLGIEIAPRDVTEDSPAARAGLRQGDLIVAAAGQPVRTIDDLFDALQQGRGHTIELTVVRGTDERTIQVASGGNGQPDQEI